MAKASIIQKKSYSFALQILKLADYLKSKKEFALSNQVLRSGTSIAANVEEALGAQSDREFLSKISISYKEARETRFWIRLLIDFRKIQEKFIQDIEQEAHVITKMLAKIRITKIKNAENNF